MSKRIFILTMLIVFVSIGVQAQRKIQQLDEQQSQVKQYEKSQQGLFDKSRWTFGGNLWGGLSSSGGYFLLQPMAGYYLKPKTIVGAGFTYIYQGYTDPYTKQRYDLNTYGPLVFVRQTLLPQLIGQIEFQPINFPSLADANNNYTGVMKRYWQNQLFIGGGYNASNASSRGGAYILVLYNVLYDQNAVNYRATPWDIRVGFMFR